MKALLYSTARACARALSPVGRFFLGGAVFLYGWYLKGSISLQKRGVMVHHPLYALVSRHHVHHALIVGISLLAIGHTVLLQRVDEQEFLLPQNALSRLFAEEDAFIVETQNFTPIADSEYVTSTDIRSQPTPTPTENTQKQSPLPQAGSLATIPDTLIKPILPTIQTEPYRAQTIQTYVVKTGDTLGNIARAHGLKLSTLLWANNLTERSVIRLGQHLVVLPVDGIHYRIKRGDTLGLVAKRFSSDIDSIVKANNLANPNAVAIGDLLMIPGGVMPTPSRYVPQQSLIGRVRDTIAPSGTSERASGSYIWPTSARRITQYFSWRHIGVDIAGPPSNRIYSAADGVVSFAGWAKGYGLSVVINHGGGKQTRYGHSRQLFVKVGQSVSQGETIAMVGSTGRSTGPHLHFEIIVNGKRVNPFAYIR
ncbi:peptidoglycan DD-metalloendopeptidase family protein [Candidatus Uhrbacteria bacterium]|nr:peptidoglycan DD-metalloendopeptidase family protein [Candidatus Uhrbacteria bacterium]